MIERLEEDGRCVESRLGNRVGNLECGNGLVEVDTVGI